MLRRKLFDLLFGRHCFCFLWDVLDDASLSSNLVLFLKLSNPFNIVVLSFLELSFQLIDLSRLGWVGRPIFVNLAHPLLLLPEGSYAPLEILIFLIKFALELFDPEGHLLSGLLFFFASWLGFLRCLDQHGD